jgi:hypothetical protein
MPAYTFYENRYHQRNDFCNCCKNQEIESILPGRNRVASWKNANEKILGCYIEPSVFLTLFAWLAPIKEGRSILQDFAAKADAPFAQPTYLAYVVLTPVKKIVGHLIDICFIADVSQNQTEQNL